MKRDDLLSVLPCYVCGDMPPEARERVRAMVEADPEIAAMVVSLSDSQGTCEEALRRAAPELLRIKQARAERARPVSALWPALLALGVLLSLSSLTHAPTPPPAQAVQAQLEAWTALHPRALPGFVASGDAAKLTEAMRAAGVPASLAEVRPVQAEGLRLLGAAPLPEGGVVMLYADAQGYEYRCVRVTERPLPVAGAETLPGAPDQAPALRSFAWRGAHAVAWRSRGALCVLISEAPRALVEGVARAKVWGRRG
ncbi:MAG: hypothetical protein H6740_04270 [Alphaproteobacteria bacterium]|nr:hypothetical protein [Alphaproteobacteria bacterium]